MVRTTVFLTMLFAIGAFYVVYRPQPITKEMAAELLATCINTKAENCIVKNDTSWQDLAGRTFRMTRSADPKLAVADYEFVSRDGQFCAFVQFGKEDLSDVRTVEFYRCANRERVTLGIG